MPYRSDNSGTSRREGKKLTNVNRSSKCVEAQNNLADFQQSSSKANIRANDEYVAFHGSFFKPNLWLETICVTFGCPAGKCRPDHTCTHCPFLAH